MREEIVRFESYDLQASGYVRPSAVLRKMQQAARENLNAFGITYRDMREKNMAFVLSRIALEFFRPLEGEKPIRLMTAPNAVHGATFPRSFLMEDERGVCARAMTLWALLDFEKRSLLRASALGENLPAEEDLSQGLSCKRLLVPSDCVPCVTDRRRVYASMLDQNHHLNNCNYADLATDLLPPSAGEVREIHLSFLRECSLGETLFLEGYESGGEWLVCGTNENRNEKSFCCQILTFEDSSLCSNC